MTAEDYLELLPVEWRQINAYGIRIDYRTYDCHELGPWRLQHSGITARRGLWEVHYGIDTNGKQRAATFRRPGQKVRRYIRTAERRGN